MRSQKAALSVEPLSGPRATVDSSVVKSSRPKPSESPFEVNLPVDVSLTAAAFTVGFLPQMMGAEAPERLDLNAAGINAMDRGVTRNWSPAADQASTALMATSIVLPFVASLVDTWVSKPSDGYSGFFKDALVLAETYAVTSAIAGIVKVSVERPRPSLYNASLGPEVRGNSDATHSFFSGHTAAAFSMATSYSYLFTLRHPDSNWVIPIWVGTHALAAATAFLRVEAGHHFWSDVLVGAAVGSAVGLAVPYLHKKDNFFSRLFFGKKDEPNVHLSIVGVGLGVGGTF